MTNEKILFVFCFGKIIQIVHVDHSVLRLHFSQIILNVQICCMKKCMSNQTVNQWCNTNWEIKTFL